MKFLSNFIDLMKNLPKSFFFATWAFYWVYTQIQWWLDSRPSNTFVTLKCWYIFWKNSVKTTWVYLPKSLFIFLEKSVQHLSVKDWKWDTQCFNTLVWFVTYIISVFSARFRCWYIFFQKIVWKPQGYFIVFSFFVKNHFSISVLMIEKWDTQCFNTFV